MRPISKLLPNWPSADIAALAPKIADTLVTDLIDAACELSADVSHKLFEVSPNMDTDDKSQADYAADIYVCITMMRLGIKGLRKLGFPRQLALLIAHNEKLFTHKELESVLALARGKTRQDQHRTGAVVAGGAGVETFSIPPAPVATPTSTESATSRSSRRAEVPEARPRKGVSGRRKPAGRKRKRQ